MQSIFQTYAISCWLNGLPDGRTFVRRCSRAKVRVRLILDRTFVRCQNRFLSKRLPRVRRSVCEWPFQWKDDNELIWIEQARTYDVQKIQNSWRTSDTHTRVLLYEYHAEKSYTFKSTRKNSSCTTVWTIFNPLLQKFSFS